MSKNIKILSVDISGDKELVEVLSTFSKLVTLKDKTKESRQREIATLDLAERLVANRLGASIVSGKLGQREVTDFVLSPTSSLVKYLYGSVSSEIEKFRSTRLEFKASTEGVTTIGQLTLASGYSFSIPGTARQVSGADIQKSIGLEGSGYILDLDERTKGLSKGADISDIVFNDYFKKSKNLRDIFYAKASSILLSTTQSSDNFNYNKLVFIKFPISKFTSQYFKATKEKNAIKLSVRTPFQNAIINQVNESHLEAIRRVRPIKKKIVAGGKAFTIDFLSRANLKGTLTHGVEVTKSLKARPVDTFNLRFSALPKESVEKTKKQRFISGAQWTALTQQRLGQTMQRFGPPDPPDLKERSGRFRSSIEVSADYKRKLLQYTYNPLYQSLEQYGYRPDIQVQRAIREVAQSLYTQKFNIRRV